MHQAGGRACNRVKPTRWEEMTLRLLGPDPWGCDCQICLRVVAAQVVRAHWGLLKWQFAAQMGKLMQGRGPRHWRM